MRRFGALVIAVVLVGSGLFAQAKPGGIARQAAMGGSQAGSGLVINPFIMEDPAFMFINPAYQTMYKDYGWLNIGGGGLTGLTSASNVYGEQNAGIAFAINRELTVGAILSHDPSAVNAVSFLIAGLPPGFGPPPFSIAQRFTQAIPPVQNVWEILGSWDAGALDIGFGFMYGSSNFDSTFSSPGASSEREASASMFGFRAGLLYDLGGGSSIDLSAALRLDNATDNITTSAGSLGEYSASGTEFQFNARAKFRISNTLNFVPYGVLAIVSAEPKEDAKPAVATAPTARSLNASALAFAIGIGGEYRKPDFYLAGGLSYQQARIKAEVASTTALPPLFPTPGSGTVKVSTTGIPVFNVGGEWWFTDWLAARAGYYRNLASAKLETEGLFATGLTTESNRSIPNSLIILGGLPVTADGSLITLGLGLKFGNFAMDATLSEEALRRGLGLIGSQDNINTLGYINASYNFE